MFSRAIILLLVFTGTVLSVISLINFRFTSILCDVGLATGLILIGLPFLAKSIKD